MPISSYQARPFPIARNGTVDITELGKRKHHIYLGMTILFDHDVTDGAPVARFAQRLVQLMEEPHGLLAEE